MFYEEDEACSCAGVYSSLQVAMQGEGHYFVCSLGACLSESNKEVICDL